MVKPWNLTDFKNLYQARHLLSWGNKRELGLLMPVDVCVQDPYVAKENEGLALNSILVECEPELTDGPTSSRIAVVDYDADEDILWEPARWDRRNKQFYFVRNGEKIPITREHKDEPQFHQVNVWAIIQSVLNMYEASWVLGRSAPWGFEGIRLIAVPHAGQLPNAYYSRPSKSIQFYYFGPPDRRIYTCLSHDIVACETGRAILDGLRPYYHEDSSVQTTAFHEFVGDLTAITISLLNNELRWKVAEETIYGLPEDHVHIVAALAEEFSRYAAGRPHLRSAMNDKTVADVAGRSSPYAWSEVMTGAMWRILAGMVAKYQARPKKNTGKLPSDKEALLWAVNRFRRVAFQPLDYLPPVDVQFSDYAKAVLKADELVDPVDENDFRGMMRHVFGNRGVDHEEDEPAGLQLYASDIDRVSRSRTDAYHFLNANRRQLCIPPEQDIFVVDLYRTDKTEIGGRKLPREIVLQYAWREDVELKGAEFAQLEGEATSLLCGGTLILDRRGNVRHWARKPGSTKQDTGNRHGPEYRDRDRDIGVQRRKQLLDYVAQLVREGQLGLVERYRPYEVSVMPPVVASRGADGTLRLEVTPHLRNRDEE